MTEKRKTTVSVTAKSLRGWLGKAKAHRVVVTKQDGNEFININLLAAGIITLIVPELVVLLTVVALLMGARLEIVDTRNGDDDTTSDSDKTDELAAVM
ncbi:MAG: hypothetical protein CUN54_09015 [Phototrophicales bacterium]|nr:MAG: hypothetical protein CUN54_09015 [Phototrophicales bacterium]